MTDAINAQEVEEILKKHLTQLALTARDDGNPFRADHDGPYDKIKAETKEAILAWHNRSLDRAVKGARIDESLYYNKHRMNTNWMNDIIHGDVVDMHLAKLKSALHPNPGTTASEVEAKASAGGEK